MTIWCSVSLEENFTFRGSFLGLFLGLLVGRSYNSLSGPYIVLKQVSSKALVKVAHSEQLDFSKIRFPPKAKGIMCSSDSLPSLSQYIHIPGLGYFTKVCFGKKPFNFGKLFGSIF
jgi:hypothetical protein